MSFDFYATALIWSTHGTELPKMDSNQSTWRKEHKIYLAFPSILDICHFTVLLTSTFHAKALSSTARVDLFVAK